ncbi:MAG: hypothetical protein KGL39_29525 [Patescibacteria group bacterium]|nr:hypothetical protein [Patescibacteria group bacterium]
MAKPLSNGHAQREPIDWEKIEAEYRAGQLSISEIARVHGISRPLLHKRAKAGKWPRSLQAKVKQEIATRAVTDGVTGDTAREMIELAAERGIKILRGHRNAIASAQELALSLLSELKMASENLSAIEEEIEAETSGDRSGERRAMMLRAVSTGGRAGTLKDLSMCLKNLIPLERQAFNLDEKEKSPPIDEGKEAAMRQELLRVLSERAARIPSGNGNQPVPRVITQNGKDA